MSTPPTEQTLSERAKDIHDRALELLGEMEDMNNTDPIANQNWWQAATSLRNSLVSLWGAFGALHYYEDGLQGFAVSRWEGSVTESPHLTGGELPHGE